MTDENPAAAAASQVVGGNAAAEHASEASETLRIELGERSYDIIVGAGQLRSLGTRLQSLTNASTAIVVSDSNVAPLYLGIVLESLSAAGVRSSSIVLPAGERTKDFSHLEPLCEAVLATGIDRRTVLVALGGGVIGDLVGFAAGVLLRGLPYVQVPTTLLAQVDSSVGGKTGINTAHGKNLVGLFHQPCLVIADTETLSTLSDRELRAGYAEVIKYGALGDADFFAWLEYNGAAVLSGDPAARSHTIRTCCAAKAAIVAADEREAGHRALLNLGHTFGHALEAEAGYDDSLRHGEAVAVGMVLAFELSVLLDLCSIEDAVRLERHVVGAGLPTRVSEVVPATTTAESLLQHMFKDKKVRQGELVFVLARGLGDAFIYTGVSQSDVLAVLSKATET